MGNPRFAALLALSGTLALGAPVPAFHTVQKGETVYAIAKQHGTTPAEILQANPGLNPARLHPGEKILLPGKQAPQPAVSTPAPAAAASKTNTWFRVRQGDTLSAISRDTGVAVTDLRRWNNLQEDTIRPGELLRLQATPPAKKAPAKDRVAGKSPEPAGPAKKTVPAWKFVGPARAEIDAPKDRLRDWEYIVVHHSGTSGGNAKIFDYYHSEQRGMENGMAYHFVIGNGSDSGDGQIEVGRRWLKQLQGGHLASESLNEISIGICLVGDFSRSRLGPRQTAALIELVQYLRQTMPDRTLKFRLHREINTRPTECPGRLFPAPAIHEILDQPQPTG